MVAATLWLAGMMLIEVLDYATNPDYGKDFVHPDDTKKAATGSGGGGGGSVDAGAAAAASAEWSKKDD